MAGEVSTRTAKNNNRKTVGHYQLGSSIRECLYGKVRYGMQQVTGKQVAIKIVPKEKLVHCPASQRHFRRELQIQHRVSHPNIVRFCEFLETRRNYYLVMELVTGGNLLDCVIECGCLPEDRGRYYMRQILFAVDYLHRSNIVHRNLRLDNFLLDARDHVKVTGFSLSSVCQDYDRLLDTQCGCPVYAAPELFAHMKYGKPVDIWSLGVSLYAMLVGQFPYLPTKAACLLDLHKCILEGLELPVHLMPSCQNLLRRMMEHDDSIRITANAAVSHPWLASLENTPIRHVSGKTGSPQETEINCTVNTTLKVQGSENGKNAVSRDGFPITETQYLTDTTVQQPPRDMGSGIGGRPANRRPSQLSEGSSIDTISGLTTSTIISHVSDSYKSCILRLKQIRPHHHHHHENYNFLQNTDTALSSKPVSGWSLLDHLKKRLTDFENSDCRTKTHCFQKVHTQISSNDIKRNVDTSQIKDITLKGVATLMNDSTYLHNQRPQKNGKHMIGRNTKRKENVFADKMHTSQTTRSSELANWQDFICLPQENTYASRGNTELQWANFLSREDMESRRANFHCREETEYLRGNFHSREDTELLRSNFREVTKLLRANFQSDSLSRENAKIINQQNENLWTSTSFNRSLHPLLPDPFERNPLKKTPPYGHKQKSNQQPVTCNRSRRDDILASILSDSFVHSNWAEYKKLNTQATHPSSVTLNTNTHNQANKIYSPLHLNTPTERTSYQFGSNDFLHIGNRLDTEVPDCSQKELKTPASPVDTWEEYLAPVTRVVITTAGRTC